MALYCLCYAYSATEVDIEIKDREREVKRSRSKYIIHAKNESFECTDSILFWKWNSTDIYRRLEKGCKYRVMVAGWRVPILSWYRNIIRIKKKYVAKHSRGGRKVSK